ncbi:Uncharacterized protein Adt_31205 [Abeliophyllum distichum]|uniref:Retrotransposon gag domain-containing protein n=1 Tax=Abeliophyllum distichum TaxID=126358 RepID=A0ABD1REI0_9LAMI
MVADIAQLHDIRQKNGETVKSYCKKFSNVINKNETVSDDKALNALVTGLHMHTPFWRDVHNSQPKTYSHLVDLIQREIQSKETIENRERAERDRGDRYRREGRRSRESRFNHFQRKCSSRPQNNIYNRFNQTEIAPTPHPRTPAMALLSAANPPKFCHIHRTRVHNTKDCPNVRELINHRNHGQGEENPPVRGHRGPSN